MILLNAVILKFVDDPNQTALEFAIILKISNSIGFVDNFHISFVKVLGSQTRKIISKLMLNFLQ